MTEATEQAIRRLYIDERLAGAAVANRLDLDPKTVYRALSRLKLTRAHGDTRRRYNFDTTFFERIDSHEKAQVLGFWYADGYVSSEGKRAISELNIAVQDIEYLEDIKRLLRSDRPIRTRKTTHQDACRLYLCGEYPRQQLIRLGCFPRKSLTLKWPTPDQVPDEFLSSFMLGYFEGDGSLFLHAPRKHPDQITGTLSVVGTQEFCGGYQRVLQRACGVKGTLRCANPLVNTWYFILGGNRVVLRAMDFLYAHASIKMARKWRVLEQIRTRVQEIDERHGDRYSVPLTTVPAETTLGSNVTLT
jgi:hypothetical protein